MTKPKVLGEQYGITITRPWNEKMYEHNELVAEEMKANILRAVRNRKYTAEQLNQMARHITGYTFGMMSREEIREELITGVNQIQNFWLNSEYDDLVKKGFCPPVEKQMIGYQK